MRKPTALLICCMLFSMLLPITAFAVLEPEPTYVIRDDCANFTKMAAELTTSDNIGIAGSAQTWAGSDKSRMYKKSHDGDLDSGTYVTYQTESPVTYFKVVGGHFRAGDVFAPFQIELSADGVDFQPFNDVEYALSTASSWTNNAFASLDWTPTAPLPDGMTYIRIRFGETRTIGRANTDIQLMKAFVSTDAAVSEQLIAAAKEELQKKISQMQADVAAILADNVSFEQESHTSLSAAIAAAQAVLANEEAAYADIKSAGEAMTAAMAAFKATITYQVPFYDECGNMDKVYACSEDVNAVTSALTGIDDNTRLAKKGYQSAYVVYRLTDSFQYFNVEAALGNVDNAIPDDMTFEVSADGAEYQAVQAFRRELNESNTTLTSGKFRIFSYECSDIPADATYLKIIFADTTGLNTYCNQLASVTINSEAINVGKITARDTVTDIGLNTKERLAEATQIEVKTTISKTSDAVTDAVVYAAIFDGDILLSVCGTNFDFSAKECTIGGLVSPGNLTEPCIKIFVWENATNIKPLTKPAQYAKS